MTCEICLDSPPSPAVVVVGGFYCCRECFDALAPNLKTDALEELQVLGQ